jgi:hypothetical protein
MAADPFNSKSGYTIGIPPIPILDSNGNLTVPEAVIGNVIIEGDQVVSGTITSNLFIGTFQGNITGNFVVPGLDTYVIFNEDGFAGASQRFTYDYTDHILTLQGDFIADSITVGSGVNEFSTTSVMFATTVSSAPEQVLHSIPANTICSVDYTVIATDSIGMNRQTSKLFGTILGAEVGYYEYGSIDVPELGPGVGDFKILYDAGTSSVTLVVTPVTANLVDYKIMVTSYKE